MTRPSQGWFESDDEYDGRIDREACERTIELSTGSKPSQGWNESDDEYLERIHREANEHVIEDVSESKPSQGWFEEDDDYEWRIELEANESLIEDLTGSRPSRGWTEGDREYAGRVRKEAFEAIIESEAGDAPSQGWTENDAEYYARIKREARELLAGREEPEDGEFGDTSPDYSSSYYESSGSYSSDSGNSTSSSSPTRHSPVATAITWAVILGIGFIIFGNRREPSSSPVSESSGTPAVVSAPGLNFRSGPGSDHSVLAALDRGEVVQVLTEKRNAWVQVRARGLTGWVNQRYLDGAANEPSPPSSSASAEAQSAEVSPRITLQYQERGDAGAVTEVFEVLNDRAGWRVGAPERVLPSGDNRPEVYGGVRFFFEEDSALARTVCEAIRTELAQRGYDVTFPLWPMITLQRQGHFRASRGLIEVWVSPLPQPVTGGNPAQMGRCGR